MQDMLQYLKKSRDMANPFYHNVRRSFLSHRGFQDSPQLKRSALHVLSLIYNEVIKKLG